MCQLAKPIQNFFHALPEVIVLLHEVGGLGVSVCQGQLQPFDLGFSGGDLGGHLTDGLVVANHRLVTTTHPSSVQGGGGPIDSVGCAWKMSRSLIS